MATGHGGRRPGAGRKRKAPAVLAEAPAPATPEPDFGAYKTPLEFLDAVMRGLIDPSPSQLKAGIAAAKYVHRVAGEGGKKEQAAKLADEVAAAGRFGARPAPLRRVA